MIKAYKLNILDTPKYMYSKSQFEKALTASGLLGKKVSRFYTELQSTDKSTLVDERGYSFTCNNFFIIETEEGDWHEFYIAGEGAMAFTKNKYVKENIFTITGYESDDTIVAQVVYDPFRSYYRNAIVGFEITEDNNLAYIPKSFDASVSDIFPQQIKLLFNDGSTLTILGEYDYMRVEFDTSVPRKKFRDKSVAAMREKLKDETNEINIKDINKSIEVLSKEITNERARDYYRLGLQNPMTKFWSMDLYTNTKGYSFFYINNINIFKVNKPVEIAKTLLNIGLKFIKYIENGDNHRKLMYFCFDTEDDDKKNTHKLYYYFDVGLVEYICVTIDRKSRSSEQLFKENKQNRFFYDAFVEDIWCIGKRYNLNSDSLNELKIFFDHLEIKIDEDVLCSEQRKDFVINNENQKYPLLGLAYRKWDVDSLKQILKSGVDCKCKQYNIAINEFSLEGSNQYCCENDYAECNRYFMAVKILRAYQNGKDYRNIFEFYKAINKTIKDISVISDSSTKYDIQNDELILSPKDKVCIDIDDLILVVENLNIYVVSRSLIDYDKAVSIIDFFPKIKNKIINDIEFSTTEIQEDTNNIQLDININLGNNTLNFISNNTNGNRKIKIL